MAAKAHWGHDLEWVTEWVESNDFPAIALARGEAYVAELDGAVSGWVALVPRIPTAWLEDLWIDPASMRRGLGKTLFLHAAERASALGASQLEWESDIDAVGFYERMGARTARHGETTELGRILPIMALDLT
jgi:GNAT superfamily N-acetyltransferase